MHKRAGYTLFELMLVMAILVIVGALSVPAIESMMSSPRVSAGQDMIRARLADIRGRAMTESRPYKFSFIDKGSRFRLEPEDPTTIDSDPDNPPLVFEGDLPDKLHFCKHEMDLMGDTSPSASGSFETLAVFLPDGTARDDAEVFVGVAGEAARGVRIRALLGAVTAFDPRQEALP